MKSTNFYLVLVLFASFLFFGIGLSDLCQKGAKLIEGNYYCQAVKAVRYKNVGHSGSYEEIISMSGDGSCGTSTKHFNGKLSPFDEEVSFLRPFPRNQCALSDRPSTALTPYPWSSLSQAGRRVRARSF